MIKRLLEKLNLIKPQKPKLVISDVSCSYIDLIGDVALIKREKDRKWAERNELE